MYVEIQKPGGLLLGLHSVTSLHLPVPMSPAPLQQLGLSGITALQQLQLRFDHVGSEYGARAVLNEASTLEHLTSLCFVNSGSRKGILLDFTGLTSVQQLRVEGRAVGQRGDEDAKPWREAPLWKVQLPHSNLQVRVSGHRRSAHKQGHLAGIQRCCILALHTLKC
jgi:hypothetical protein